MAAALASWLLLPSTKVLKVKSALIRLPRTAGAKRRALAAARAMASLEPLTGAASGAAPAAAVPVRVPTSSTTSGTDPSANSRINSLIRGSELSPSHSITYRFGASSFSSPTLSIACRGRTQVLNCCIGSSLSSMRRQRFHSDSDKSALLPCGNGANQRKGRESSSNLPVRLLTHPRPLEYPCRLSQIPQPVDL